MLVRRPPDLVAPPNLDVVVQDLGEPLTLEPQRAEVDAIVHLAQAAAVLPDEAPYLFSVNVQSTVALLHFGRCAGIRKFIFVSSGSVYRAAEGLYDEESPLAPSDLYAASKISAEAACAAFSDYFDVCVLRLFQPYGPGQRDRLIPHLADRLIRRQPIALNVRGRPMVSPVYISDVVRCIECAIDVSGHVETTNVAGDDVVSIKDLACMIAGLLHVVPRFEETGNTVGDLAGQNRRMHALLGISSLVRLPQGLALTFAQLTDHEKGRVGQ